MLFEQSEVRSSIQAIAWKYTRREGEAREFAEDGAVYVWRAESQAPGQSVSWYLQRWQHHLRDALRSGRSVDARKRDGQAVRLDDPGVEARARAELEGLLIAREDTFAKVSARDIWEQLSAHLRRPRDVILKLLTDGWRLQEIGRTLGVSPATVHAHVVEIRKTARRLGIYPEAGI